MERFKNTFLLPHGRLNRLQYFGYSFGIVFVGLVSILIPAAVIQGTENEFLVILFALISIAMFVLMLYTTYVVLIKRLHDFNQTGYHLIWIVPLNMFAGSAKDSGIGLLFSFASLIVGLGILFYPGDSAPNKYGEPPK